MKQLTTFRTWGDRPGRALEGFGRLFLGSALGRLRRFFGVATTRRRPSEARRAGRALRRAQLRARRTPCRWLSPSELSTLMGLDPVGDLRQLRRQARAAEGLRQQPSSRSPPTAAAEGEDFWFDYTADVGDGFDATYTVAALMAQDRCASRARRRRCRAGRCWCSAATRSTRRRRRRPTTTAWSGPTARPCRRPTPQPLHAGAAGQPRLVRRADGVPAAVHPGPVIGGWRTEQKRSYWTVRLPHGWWLVGLDSQLDSYFDDPQLQLLRGDPHRQPVAGRQRHRLLRPRPPGSRPPSGNPDAFNGLEWFERNFVTSRRVAGQQRARADGGPGAAVAQRRQAPLPALRRAPRRTEAPAARRVSS